MHKITFLTAESDRTHITAAWVRALPESTLVTAYIQRMGWPVPERYSYRVTKYTAAEIACVLCDRYMIAAMIVEPEVAA